MLTPILLDVAGLTGLKPIGQTFDPDIHHSEMTLISPDLPMVISSRINILPQALMSMTKSTLLF